MDVVALMFLMGLIAMACLFAIVADCELVAGSSILGFLPEEEDLKSESRMSELFENWIRVHDKDYGNVVAEKDRRFLNFKDNLRYLDAAHDKSNVAAPYWLKLNKFADLSTQEFRSMYMGTKIDSTRKSKTGRTHVLPQPDVAESIIDSRENDGADVGVTERGGSWGDMTAAQSLIQHTKEDGQDQSYQHQLSVEVRDKGWEIISSSPLRNDVVKFSNGTELQLFPSSEPVHKHMNETRRRLGDFQQCSPCTCCDRTRSWCIPTACCYNIRCNLQGLPFGLCSFVPISCTCYGCTS